MLTIIKTLVYFEVITFILFLFYECLPKKNKNYTKKSQLLFNASVNEKGVPANQVFETLEKNNIKPNFLG